jgi:hypothetical protein
MHPDREKHWETISIVPVAVVDIREVRVTVREPLVNVGMGVRIPGRVIG